MRLIDCEKRDGRVMWGWSGYQAEMAFVYDTEHGILRAGECKLLPQKPHRVGGASFKS